MTGSKWPPWSLPSSGIGAPGRLQNLEHLAVPDGTTLPYSERSPNREVLERLRHKKLDPKAGGLPRLESIGASHS